MRLCSLLILFQSFWSTSRKKMDLCNSFISQCPQAVFRWKYLNESIFKNKYNMQVYNKMVWLALRIFYDGDIYDI